MTALSWLDYSEDVRRRTLDAIDQFKEEDTRDELGIGVIRDAFSDRFFPGTSTIQTRAKYFLFIPWVFLELERCRIPGSEFGNKSRKIQDQLRQALEEGGESLDVIGSRAGYNVQRLPSNIYWQGLIRLGIFNRDIPESGYIKGIDRYYQKRFDEVVTEEGESAPGSRGNWDDGLQCLRPPSNWRKTASFALTRGEADYLDDHIQRKHRNSYLAFLLERRALIEEEIRFPWEHPCLEGAAGSLLSEIGHARLFSELMHGAALLYNLILAEQTENREKQIAYESGMSEWWRKTESGLSDYRKWNQKSFEELIRNGMGARVSKTTWDFIREWHEFRKRFPRVRLLCLSDSARQLIAARESHLKGSRRRIDNPQAKATWAGASGTSQLDFRWNRPVRAIVNDIVSGLKWKSSHA